jgi:hypothetical protein
LGEDAWPARVSWIKLTIFDVYPGERHADTCISKFYFNQEEFGAARDAMRTAAQ